MVTAEPSLRDTVIEAPDIPEEEKVSVDCPDWSPNGMVIVGSDMDPPDICWLGELIMIVIGFPSLMPSIVSMIGPASFGRVVFCEFVTV